MSSQATTMQPAQALTLVERQQRGKFSTAFTKLRKRPGALIGLFIILLFIIIAIAAPVLAPDDPNAISRDRRAAPSRRKKTAPRREGRRRISDFAAVSRAPISTV